MSLLPVNPRSGHSLYFFTFHYIIYKLNTINLLISIINLIIDNLSTFCIATDTFDYGGRALAPLYVWLVARCGSPPLNLCLTNVTLSLFHSVIFFPRTYSSTTVKTHFKATFWMTANFKSGLKMDYFCRASDDNRFSHIFGTKVNHKGL